MEASSGSTAVSEAYFARLLGLPFVAVMPRSTSPEKIEAIRFYGGNCHLVDDPLQAVPESQRLARENAAISWINSPTPSAPPTGAATTTSPSPCSGKWRWKRIRIRRGSSAIAALAARRQPLGATSAIAHCPRACWRPIRKILCSSMRGPRATPRSRWSCASRIEGIGRPRVERSFVPGVIDRMMKVPDALSIGAIHYLERVLGRRCGGSIGHHLIGALTLAREMQARGESGSIAMILCDGGERYRGTYYDAVWLKAQGLMRVRHWPQWLLLLLI